MSDVFTPWCRPVCAELEERDGVLVCQACGRRFPIRRPRLFGEDSRERERREQGARNVARPQRRRRRPRKGR